MLKFNDWMSLSEFQDRPSYSGIGRDVLHVKTNTVYRNHKYSSNDGRILLTIIVKKDSNGRDDWDNAEYVYADESECLFRYEDKQYAKLAKILPELSVGDWVRCSGSKGYRWRKIVSINLEHMIIYGQCARRPSDEYLAYHSSDNGIVTIVEHIKGTK